MANNVDETSKTIQEMIEVRRLRRQNGLTKPPLVDTILQRNKLQPPKKPLKVKEIR